MGTLQIVKITKNNGDAEGVARPFSVVNLAPFLQNIISLALFSYFVYSFETQKGGVPQVVKQVANLSCLEKEPATNYDENLNLKHRYFGDQNSISKGFLTNLNVPMKILHL